MEDKKGEQSINRNVNLDATKVNYVDDVSMTINKFGVVFDFGQKLANTNQIQIVNRVGMSKEFAKEFYRLFTSLLALSEGQIETKKKN